MSRIRLLIEYDGTGLSGWQRQANGMSVQQLLEEALAQVVRHPVTLHGAGRTDAGVHARGMTAHFTTPRELPLSAYRQGVNNLLPAQVAVQKAEVAPPRFHARFDAIGKWYRYSIYRAVVRSPLHARTSWQLRHPLDLDSMRTAAAVLEGRHDFSAFRSAHCNASNPERTVHTVRVVEEGQLLHVDVEGEGFLRNMVRLMVGTLVEVGIGRRPCEDVARLLHSASCDQHRLCAPPQGLCLMAVHYPPAGESRRAEWA